MTRHSKEAITALLTDKALPKNIFSHQGITFGDDIALHARWAFEHIYQYPYAKTGVTRVAALARPYHGIQHVTRTAIYIPILINLYRGFGNVEAERLTETDVKLLQIAMLFHDAGREKEGKDEWDCDSALLCYYYLTEVLDVDIEIAIKIAEAIANKEPAADRSHEPPTNNPSYCYYKLKLLSGNMPVWVISDQNYNRNIYQKIIHDADCLDIIRVRYAFDARYLDFYEDYADNNADAFSIMAKLITEVRAFTGNQGDVAGNWQVELKQQYENDDAYKKMLHLLNDRPLFALLKKGYNAGDCTSKDINYRTLLTIDLLPSTSDFDFNALMNAGQLFARGVGIPSALTHNKYGDTFAALEVYKILRRPDIPTRKGKMGTAGNNHRSVSMLSHGSYAFACVGFLMTNLDNIYHVSLTNAGTGRGKKDLIRSYPALTEETKIKELKILHRKTMMGGTTVGSPKFTNQNEIIATFSDVTAVYYTNDLARHNTHIYNSYVLPSASSPLAQAIYLRDEYKATTGIGLPIVYYSGVNNTIVTVQISNDDIVEMWRNLCLDYFKNLIRIQPRNIISVFRTREEIKLRAVYPVDCLGRIIYDKRTVYSVASVDKHYREELKLKVNKAISEQMELWQKRYMDELIPDIDAMTTRFWPVCLGNLRTIENNFFQGSLSAKIFAHIKINVIERMKNFKGDLKNKDPQTILCILQYALFLCRIFALVDSERKIINLYQIYYKQREALLEGFSAENIEKTMLEMRIEMENDMYFGFFEVYKHFYKGCIESMLQLFLDLEITQYESVDSLTTAEKNNIDIFFKRIQELSLLLDINENYKIKLENQIVNAVRYKLKTWALQKFPPEMEENLGNLMRCLSCLSKLNSDRYEIMEVFLSFCDMNGISFSIRTDLDNNTISVSDLDESELLLNNDNNSFLQVINRLSGSAGQSFADIEKFIEVLEKLETLYENEQFPDFIQAIVQNKLTDVIKFWITEHVVKESIDFEGITNELQYLLYNGYFMKYISQEVLHGIVYTTLQSTVNRVTGENGLSMLTTYLMSIGQIKSASKNHLIAGGNNKFFSSGMVTVFFKKNNEAFSDQVQSVAVNPMCGGNV